ncbi:MAG: hypothetical protein IK099_08470 [Clostridia bacterium]|nr:hypothetical protein [Clostridia bacterium]
MEKKKRTKMYEHTAENDLRYRGPLGPLSFQILGWICIILSLVVTLIKLGSQFDPSVETMFGGLAEVLGIVSECSLPFLLMSSFAKILNGKNGYKGLLLSNGGAALGIIAATFLFGGRYFIGTMEQLVVQKEEVVPMVNTFVRMFVPSGYIAFNIFIDLFMCTLTMSFLNVRPKRVFTGKKVLILRFCVIIPIAYEAVSLWLKFQSVQGNIMLPLWSYALLTVKPPMMVLLFFVMAFVVKIREYRFCSHGRTYEEYQEFMQSNRNSFSLSVRLCVMMFIFAVLDLIMAGLLSYMQADMMGAVTATGEIAEEAMMTVISRAMAVGFGQAWPMILVSPFMLLFSYNREPKNKMIGTLLPVAAIVIMILITFEAIRFGVGELMVGKKIDLEEMEAMLMMLLVE